MVVLRIVFNFILPVFRITSATSNQMRRMQEQMKEMERKMNEPPPAPKKVKKEGDYIEYEELK
jgi:hypothetical protein